jgi:threonine aldolase
MAKYTARNEFRSDTFTTPSRAMLEASLDCSVGDAVYDEDDDTNELQRKIADMTGKESGLFCVSGTLANQIAVRTHLKEPPYSIICDYRAHIYVHEAAGLAMLSNAMVLPVRPANGLYITLEDIEEYFIEDDGDIHGAPTKLVALENTLHGIVYPYEELLRISHWCSQKHIPLHCDGARLWNASVESGITFKQYGEIFDSISICLSKSIGAPIGSVLVGTQEFIKKATHYKKQCGGGIRQSGPMARMAMVAIEENLPKLKESHRKAQDLAQHLIKHGIELNEPPHTNFVFIDVKKSPIDNDLLMKYAEKYNVNLWAGRIAFHYQVDEESLENVKKAIVEAFEESKTLENKRLATKIYNNKTTEE